MEHGCHGCVEVAARKDAGSTSLLETVYLKCDGKDGVPLDYVVAVTILECEKWVPVL